MDHPLILASGSAARAKMLQNAGLYFQIQKPTFDESSLQNSGKPAREIARLLAIEKARQVSRNYPDHLILGADQVLTLGDQLLTKASSLLALKQQLMQLQGKTHRLISAAVIVQNGTVVFETTQHADLTMRPLTDRQIDAYIQNAGSSILASVGGYQIEKEGAGLFQKIDGDMFVVMGLPLLPLLGYLLYESA